MNIIFLDIDGVLNSIDKLIEVYKKTGRPHSGSLYPFDEKCLKNLQLLVTETNSKIVITSTWRRDKQCMNVLLNTLDNYNLKSEVIGYTPILYETRENEIKKYLSKLNELPNFVIIDDIVEMGELSQYLIVTSPQTGLTEENVQEAIKALKFKDKLKKEK